MNIIDDFFNIGGSGWNTSQSIFDDVKNEFGRPVNTKISEWDNTGDSTGGFGWGNGGDSSGGFGW